MFVDDSYLQGDTYESCLNNILDTLNLLRELGFAIHPEKSILIASQEIIFLGFVISSKKTALALTDKRKIKIKAHCLNNNVLSLREFAKMKKMFVATYEMFIMDI